VRLGVTSVAFGLALFESLYRLPSLGRCSIDEPWLLGKAPFVSGRGVRAIDLSDAQRALEPLQGLSLSLPDGDAYILPRFGVRKAAFTVEEASGPGQFLSAHHIPSPNCGNDTGRV
jgi:hypothetical protein